MLDLWVYKLSPMRLGQLMSLEHQIFSSSIVWVDVDLVYHYFWNQQRAHEEYRHAGEDRLDQGELVS